MIILQLVTMLYVLIFLVEGKVVDKFIKSFVENERRPTMVVFHGVCWKNSFKMRLMKELSKAGIRSSSSMSEGTSLQDHTLLLLTDLDCSGAVEVIENATHRDLYRLPYRWLLLSDTQVDGAAQLWDQFLVDSDLVVAAADGEGYRMTELHKTARDGPTILTPRGVFHGILTDMRPHRELYRRRCDVMGAPIAMINSIQSSNSTIDHILNEDLLELEHDVMARNGWTYAKTGFMMLNATPVAKFSNNFGFLRTGRWTGMIKDLIDYKGTNIGMTSARLDVVSYIDVMDNSRPRFIFRQPSLSLTSNIFSLPFSSAVWIATGIISFAAGLAFWLSITLIGRTANSNRATGGDGAIDGEVMRDAFLLTMGAISQQGVEVYPRNVSARIILWVIFTTLMALYAAYSANIVVLLQASSTSVNNLAQLAKSKLTLAAIDVDYNHFLFKGGLTGSDPVRNEISKRVDPDKGPKAFYNITVGVEKIRKGLFAFHGLVEPVYRQIEKTFQEAEKCDLVEIDYLGFSGLNSPVSKTSPYVELLRVVYPRLREVGVKAAINNRFETRKPACKGSVAMFSSVGVTELRPVLIFMMYGVALSVGVASMELLVFHVNRFMSARVHLRRFIEERRI